MPEAESSNRAELPIERNYNEDLAAALELKTFLITQGIDVDEDVLTSLAELENPSSESRSDHRPHLSNGANRRLQLDKAVLYLTQIGDVDLNDFRDRTGRARGTIRRGCLIFGTAFLSLAFADLCLPMLGNPMPAAIKLPAIGVWAIAMGGLGAVTSLVITHLRNDDRSNYPPMSVFEAAGRVMLGILFSFAVTMSAIFTEVSSLFDSNMSDGSLWKSSIQLAPFVVGYSVPLALGILDKILRAVALAFGINENVFGALPTPVRRPSHGRGRSG